MVDDLVNKGHILLLVCVGEMGRAVEKKQYLVAVGRRLLLVLFILSLTHFCYSGAGLRDSLRGSVAPCLLGFVMARTMEVKNGFEKTLTFILVDF